MTPAEVQQETGQSDRERALRAVKVLGARACAYTVGDEWANFCDCKYGMESDRSSAERSYCGEQTGCPEMRDVANVLHEMTDEEWAANRQRTLERVLADPAVKAKLAEIADQERDR